MKKTTREALDAYYKEAGSWAYDKIEANNNSRRVAWIVASIAVFLAILLCVAVVAILPLKSVVPYTLLVDKHTGYVETLKPLDAKSVKPDSALTQSFLVQYVTAREGFDIDGIQNDFKHVKLWTTGSERINYINQMQASSANSPLNIYPRNSVVKVSIKSISQLGPNTSLVRFDTQMLDSEGSAKQLRSWASVVRYQFNSVPMTQEERFINPLGFQVSSYNRSAETLSEFRKQNGYSDDYNLRGTSKTEEIGTNSTNSTNSVANNIEPKLLGDESIPSTNLQQSNKLGSKVN